MSLQDIEDIYPLSPMQQGMLFHSLYEPDSGVYVEQMSCALHGDLNVPAFEQAWQYVIDRHPILRTAFLWEELDAPLQVVQRAVEFAITCHDWRALPVAEQTARAEAFLRSERERGFALAEAPLLRLALLRTADEVYRLAWTHHHLLLDGWSLPLLLQEVFACYEAFHAGQRPWLDPAPLYSEYIAWLQQRDLGAAEQFWRAALAGFTAPTPLGIGRRVSAETEGTFVYAERSAVLSGVLTKALQSLARRHRLTLNTLIQGAWALLLSRYSGEEDVVFGATVAGRPADLPGAEAMIGLFINTLPVRVRVAGDQPLLEWLQGLQAQQAELRQYEYSPLVEIQGWSELPRGVPLFESLLVVENYPVGEALREQPGSITIGEVQSVEQTNYPLTFTLSPGRELALQLEYDARRFAADDIERMLGHIQLVLERFVADPGGRLAGISLLTPAERELMRAWNATSAPLPAVQGLHQLIEAQAARTPDAVAVVCGEARLSYGELNARANQLARHLRGLGVSPEVLVGLCAERSLAQLVGLLAVLKAGGAYLPLDPSYPAERLRFMLADSGATVLLTRRAGDVAWLGEVPTGERPVAIVELEADHAQIDRQPATDLACATTLDSLAYVIYTSGSTGLPKGVLIEHRAALNHNLAVGQRFALRPGDRVLQFATLAFDTAVEEIFPTLQRGATLVLRPAGPVPSVAELLRLVDDAQLSVLDLPTAYWHTWVAELARQALPLPPSLRLVIVGGEAVDPERYAAWRRAAPAVEWLNTYGPTEATVIATIYAPPPDVPPDAENVPIGYPIANTRAYILDRQLQPVPVGVPGELYLGGLGLARGYLRRSGLTAERFIASPFGDGGRLYRTGDRARHRPDGAIEFLGRVDQQVKIRGFRVEPGEVEAALRQHPGLYDVAVLARADASGATRLVAYVVPSGDTPAGEEALIAGLRASLEARLPEYMLPAAFVVLGALPLTPSGKIDRRALPAPELPAAGAGAQPRTPDEELLAVLFAQVLGLQRVGRDEDFFVLGGHSLLATQLVARVREAFRIELPLRAVFEAPTVAGLAATLASVRSGSNGLASPPITRAARTGALPLAYAQQRLWFLDQLEPGSATYNVPLAVAVHGPLDPAALAAGLEALAARHEALRTVFPSEQGQPHQVILPPGPVPLPLLDLRPLSQNGREAEVRRLARVEAEAPFDLGRGPLLRARLLRLADDEHVLLLTLHHIITDGWSMGLLLQELALLSAARRLPEPRLQYADYALWQRTWLAQPDERGQTVLERQLAYWRERLAGAPPLLELPTDRPRPPLQTYNGATLAFALPAELSSGLAALGRQQGATLFMTLLAAFQVLLARYSRQSDICVGTPIAGRTRAELEGVVGFFVNTLVLRGDLAGAPPFVELLQQVRERTLEAYAHQDVPLEVLVEALQPRRDMRHAPLFQVLFAFQNTPRSAVEIAGLSLQALELESSVAKFDLTLVMAEEDDGLHAALEYNTDLFEGATIERMAGHFQTLLAAIVADPEQPIDRLPLLPAAERELLLATWNATSAPSGNQACLHRLIEAQAARTPDAVAVVCGDSWLTYAALNARANQLARHLHGLGVGPEVLVGLCAERSPDLIVGLLAILKAGGAYLPLDPTYPAERLRFMLADSGATVLLARQAADVAWLSEAPAGERPVAIVELEAGWPQLAHEDDANLPDTVALDDLAYVIYTSGSTGLPKGVPITQRAIADHCCDMIRHYELSTSDRVLQFAALNFDASLEQILPTLIAGARLVLRDGEVWPPADFHHHVLKHELTVINLPTAYWAQLAQEWAARPELVPAGRIRLVIIGGDAMRVETTRLWQATPMGPARLLNAYGPTETTITATTYAVPLPLPAEVPFSTLPIGRPLPNRELYILDPQREPVPVGVPGELYLGGAGLARGYLNRPELSAERFVASPFRSGGRLYKTGDLARYLPDGTVEFLGRVDQQIKIRGFRVEPGEVEAILLAHPAVREAAVIARADRPGDRQLAAYLVLQRAEREGGAQAVRSELRAFLQARLPEYMVPSAFVLLEELPLTPSGKLDRQALPSPDEAAFARGGAHVPPRTPVEQQLAALWAGLLGVSLVGRDDSFFALGGHSLLATQLVARLREAFRVELPLRAVFEAPTIAELARRVEEAQRGPSAAPALIPQAPRPDELPLSFAQQRLWFLDQLEPESPAYNLPLAVRLQGALDLAALRASLDGMVARHEGLRTTFPAEAGRPIQRIGPPAPLPLTLVDLAGLSADEGARTVERYALAEAGQPFDLARGPLLRARLLHLAHDEHVLLLTLHHIITDGWSMEVLLRELAALYAAARGDESALEPLPIQYADYALWQRQWLQGAERERQMAYWRERLAGLPPLLELPTDRPRPPVQTFSGATLSFALDPDLSAGVQRLSAQEGATIFMTLLAAFQVLLMRYSGQTDLAVGVPVAGRPRRELEGLIGFFVNTLVLRADLAGGPSFRALLAQAREAALGAYAHQDLPFELLVEALQPRRDLSHTPLFQVMFVLQNTPQGAIDVPGEAGLTVGPLEFAGDVAKFDLTLFVAERDGQLCGQLEYNTDLFDATTIERMARHFRAILASAVADPERPVDQLPLLDEAERRRLLVEWNDTTAEFPADRCVHELFEEQVARTPEAVALVYAGSRLTYAELNGRANQLAHHLRGLGVGPETLVGLCVERSLELVVGLLGVLKAGAGYLPLDLTYPAERLRFMLEDAQVSVLLTREQDRGAPFVGAGVTLTPLRLDADWPVIAQQPATNPPHTATSENLAYVIYTSGSTGKPKGAEILHRGMVNYLHWCLQAYPVAAGQGAPVHSSISFDLTVTSLFTPLLAGRRVHLAPKDVGVELLAELLRRERDFSLIKITPAHLDLLSRQLDPEDVAGRTRACIIGGEQLTSEMVAWWQAHTPATRLVNEYGPTETVVGCCVYEVPPGPHRPGAIPIGRPIANTQLYILDEHMQPVPVGVSGELYIGGAGVARGYRNRPELTAAVFIADPFRPGGRLYRTGDRARYRADGVIEFLGRRDDQVKIRGFRIELGEIEAALAAHSAVAEAAVIAREDQPGERRLVAYVAPCKQEPGDQGQRVAAPELRAFLAGRLPEYMVPAAFVLLDALPLTANGKVDRARLPAPGGERPELTDVYLAPRDEAERSLAEIWSQVLGLDRVGVHDNFFELGGDSILSIQVIARANLAGLRLAPRHLFQAPTVAGLAALAGTGRPIEAEQGPVEGLMPLTPIQRWFFEQEQPEPWHWNQALLLETALPLERTALAAAVEHLLAHHDALRLRFLPGAEGVLQLHSGPGAPAPLAWYDLDALDPVARAAAIASAAGELQASLSLAEGPLVRLAYFACGPGQAGRLLLAAHHLAVDGVSWQILIDDLLTLYRQLSQGQPVRLAPKTTSFRQWAQRLAAYAAGEAVRAELPYWLEVTAGPLAPLPVDHRDGENLEATAASVVVALDPDETAGLLRDVPAAYRSEINDALLAALTLACEGWAGAGALLVDLEGHGREDLFDEVDLSRTVGWFTTIYPVRLEPAAHAGPEELLLAVRERLRRVPRRGIGYGLLRYMGDGQARSQLGATPRAEISFNYLGQIDRALAGDTTFALASEAGGPDRSPRSRRPYLLDVVASVAEGRLQVEWIYSTARHEQGTVAAMADSFVAYLRALIAHCRSPQAGAYSPIDVAEFGWDAEDFAEIVAEITKSDLA